jgi:hypothetical protein
MRMPRRTIFMILMATIWVSWAFKAQAAQPYPSALDPKVTQGMKEASKVPLVPGSDIPDLSLESLTVTPSPLNQGEVATLTIVVKNIGGAKNRAVPLFLHGDEAALQAFGVPMQNGVEHGVSMPELGPGQGFTYATTKPINLSPKTYTIQAIIWPGHQALNKPMPSGSESNLSNNEKEIQLTVKPAAVKPSNLGPKHKIPVENLPAGYLKN